MLIITEDEVENLLVDGEMIDALIDALAAAMADLSAGLVSLPPRTAALIDPATATGLLDMPAYVPSAKALTSKLVSVFPSNTGTAVPVRQAVIVVFDPQDGRPAALVEGTHLTAMRTGACSALSARLLAREDASTLAVLGTGAQARAHALTVSRVRPFRELRLAGRSRAKASALARALEGQVPMPITVCGSFEQAQEGADVVAAATYATEPVVRREWLAPGAHVSSVGYHPNGRELDDATVAEALLVVESRAAALNAVPPNRDLSDPLASGVITEAHVHAELGELVAGTATGRTAADQLTLYKSVGVAVQDAAAAALVLTAAGRRVGGHPVPGS